MTSYLTLNEWSVIEDKFYPELNLTSEKIFSLGNGRMGQRGSFEEKYSGLAQPGHFLSSFLNPAGTSKIQELSNRAGIINNITPTPSWLEVDVEIDGQPLDLATCKVLNFRRELNLREGYLERTFQAQMADGKIIEVSALRFVSVADDELGAIRYAIMPHNFDGQITVTVAINGEFRNNTNLPNTYTLSEINQEVEPGGGYLLSGTHNNKYQVATGMRLQLEKDGTGVETTLELLKRPNYLANRLTAPVKEGEQLVLYKYAAVVSTDNYDSDKLEIACGLALERATQIGFAEMLDAQAAVWAEKWQESDIIIKGDLAAQQAIRYNIFQLLQTYTGIDDRQPVTRYGLSQDDSNNQETWETDLFCLPFFLTAVDPHLAQNLLIFRYHQMAFAQQNGFKHGFTQGGALYPLNLAENSQNYKLTYADLLSNAALGFAINHYWGYTHNPEFLSEFGLPMLIGLARFWAHWVNQHPEPYQNQPIGNTDYLAAFTLNLSLKALTWVKQNYPANYQDLLKTLNLNESQEVNQWESMTANLQPLMNKEPGSLWPDNHLDKNQKLQIKLVAGQETNLNSEKSLPNAIATGEELPEELLWLLLLTGGLKSETLHQYYHNNESGLTSESPVSAGIRSIIAAQINQPEAAYSWFLRSVGQPFNLNQEEKTAGLNIPGLGAAWLALVYGLGGVRLIEESLHINPIIPASMQSFSFKHRFQNQLLHITVTATAIKVLNEGADSLHFYLKGEAITISPNQIENYAFKT